VPVVAFVLKRTNFGLIVRSVGKTRRRAIRWGFPCGGCVISRDVCGMMAGLGGAFVSMGQLSFFTEGMIAGKGYMTLAAIVFGNYMRAAFSRLPAFRRGKLPAVSLQSTASAIPYQLWVMLPYLFAVAALCMYRVRSKAPACSGLPYVRD
jgi:simple sugar transport system permease protein